jgi:molybdopterin-guanine dinucleotide biosynthesis protein A
MLETLGVVVAGGRGRRLGLPVPKAMATLAGASLLERAVATLEGCCDEIVVAAPRDCPLTLPRSAVPIRRVADSGDRRGPLAGLVAALEALPGRRSVVLGVDFPLIRPATLRFLLGRLAGGRAAVIPVPAGVPQPLVAAYAEEASDSLPAQFRAGERSLTAAALALEPLLLGDSALRRCEGGLENFFNLNTPQDLARAEDLLLGRQPTRGAV